jgi:hypothetical protein
VQGIEYARAVGKLGLGLRQIGISLTIAVTLVVIGALAVPAIAAIKYQLGTVYIKNGEGSGAVTFYTEDESYGSVNVQDRCPGDGHWVSAEIQIKKNLDDLELAYVSTRGHKCGYGASATESVNSLYFDHKAARLRVCRYPTGSFDPTSCEYTSWRDNPYDD